MNTLYKIVMMVFFIIVPLISEASTLSHEKLKHENNSILFQIVQDQIIFDRSTVESATISPSQDGSKFFAIDIKLKPAAADQFESLTQKNIGKNANIILNKSMISSARILSKLGNQFIVGGFTKEQAKAFVNSLNEAPATN